MQVTYLCRLSFFVDYRCWRRLLCRARRLIRRLGIVVFDRLIRQLLSFEVLPIREGVL